MWLCVPLGKKFSTNLRYQCKDLLTAIKKVTIDSRTISNPICWNSDSGVMNQIFTLTQLCRWKDTIRMDLKEIGINMRNWVDSAQDKDYWRALVNATLNSGFHKPWS